MERAEFVGLWHTNQALGFVILIASETFDLKFVLLDQWEKNVFNSSPSMRKTSGVICGPIDIFKPFEDSLVKRMISTIPLILVSCDMLAGALKNTILKERKYAHCLCWVNRPRLRIKDAWCATRKFVNWHNLWPFAPGGIAPHVNVRISFHQLLRFARSRVAIKKFQ